MFKKTCVRLVMSCLFVATVGISANDSSAGEVGAMLFDGTVGSSYKTCDWWPRSVYAEAKMYSSSGRTICVARSYNTYESQFDDCDSWGNSARLRLRTAYTTFCDEWDWDVEGVLMNCPINGQNLRRDGGSCSSYSLQAIGYGEN